MTNPLLEDWTTPFGLPPFDRIEASHFVPAFEVAMEAHLAEIEAIATDPAPATFANTIEAMERAGRTLDQVASVFFNLVSSLGGADLEAVDTEMSPRLARHGMTVSLDPRLFARIDAIHAHRDALELEPDQRRLLERKHLGFIRSGAALDETAKARMRVIGERLAVLHTRFGQNVLHDEKAWHLPLGPEDLGGLPDFVVAGAAMAAEERGIAGHAVTLSRSLIEPFLTFSDRRDLRERAWRAWTARGMHPGEHDNRTLIPEILSLRRERAQLLGYDDYAAYRLADSMAGSTEAARGLLAEVWAPAKRKAARERDRLAAHASGQGFNDAIAAWDWRYYAEQVRRIDHAVDEEALKPYLAYPDVQRAAFDVAGRLFGITMTPIEDAARYHPDVAAFEVRDADGHVGVFLADPHARPDKRSGAWMSAYRSQEALDAPVAPIIVNNNNLARGTPTLLSFSDAETLFHEFGHALHGLLSRVRYPSQSGTSVRRDFVEFPSQIYERWFSLPETLRTYARHHRTGEAMPDALMAGLLGSRGFDQGFGTVEYTSSALIDLALHTHPNPGSIDIETFERDFLASIGMPAEIAIRHRPAHFQHLFAGDGYAASYYAYMWSEVLDADGFEAFEETGDAFDRDTAARLRTVLSAGDTRDPMALYRDFRGRAPASAALLRSRELVEG